MTDWHEKSDEYWRQKLTPEEYHVCRDKGTERPFTGIYNAEKRDGVYHCKCCGAPLFTSATKFDAGCGWPSFYQAGESSRVAEKPDYSHGMVRTEITCADCGCHLGHVFDDGPQPTGLRYCVNSLSIDLVPTADGDKKEGGR